MAIQIPNAGTGNGQTGDNEYVLWQKTINNFSDQTNAASKLIGNGAEQVPLGKHVSDLTYSTGAVNLAAVTQSIADAPFGKRRADGSPDIPTGHGTFSNITTHNSSYGTAWQFASPYANGGTLFYLRAKTYGSTYGAWGQIYTSNNTTIVNGSLKPSSPVVKIHTDSLELNDDAERMGVTLNKRGVGDYLLQNTTGLRNDGGWRIELPQDVNGNPYFAVAYDELENNDIEVKTYKRIFDMSTFMFVPDLENPVDIKEGRSIAIRFNDLPDDVLDDTQVEGIAEKDK